MSIVNLIALSSSALASSPAEIRHCVPTTPMGDQLWDLLCQKNGFYVFESALHVYPVASDTTFSSDESAQWSSAYEHLIDGLYFFAADIFGNQFALTTAGIVSFDAETGMTEMMTSSLEEWATCLLTDPVWSGRLLARQWQELNDPLSIGQRLFPKIPFVLGGEFILSNLYAGEAVSGMRFRGNLALKLESFLTSRSFS